MKDRLPARGDRTPVKRPADKNCAVELYRKYRPQGLKQVVGQHKAVASLRAMLERGHVNHSLLFVGPSGCGKTTLARIMARTLGCVGSDLVEINAADSRGIDTIREIRDRVGLMPAFGKSRVWVIDECARLTPDAQSGLLKVLEECPEHAYLMLATTDPQKLLKTIVTRCGEVKVSPVSELDLIELMRRVIDGEEAEVDPDVILKIAGASDGSARKALVILQQVIGIAEKEAQLEAIEAADPQREAITLARLLFNPKATWKEVSVALKEIESDPETLRHIVLGYATSVLLGNNPRMASRAMQLIDLFRDHWYDCKRAGLVAACYEAMASQKGR